MSTTDKIFPGWRTFSTEKIERLWLEELSMVPLTKDAEKVHEQIMDDFAAEIEQREAGPAYGGTERDQDRATHRDFGGLA